MILIYIFMDEPTIFPPMPTEPKQEEPVAPTQSSFSDALKSELPKQETAKDPDVEANKAIAAIGYLGILCLIPLLAKKNSPFAQHHGKQGLVIVIAWLILFVANVIPFLGQIAWFVGSLLLLALVILGIINALNGKFWEMPFLGEYAKRIKL